MSTDQKPNVVADDIVVSLDYTLTVEGEVLDSSEDVGPLEFIQGHQNIIPGLERQLYGMSIGQSKNVDVTAVDGYGVIDKDAIMDIPRAEFPSDIPLEIDIQLQVRDVDGDVLDARIVKVSDESVRLDFNHPLAGKELHFDVKVVDLREPTPEELEHGHVHGDDYDEDEEYFEDDLEDDDEDEEEEDEIEEDDHKH